jgi:hypothetical protein
MIVLSNFVVRKPQMRSNGCVVNLKMLGFNSQTWKMTTSESGMTMPKKMTQERWLELMKPVGVNEDMMLTAEELADGWHWCDEWDSLLIHVDDREFEHCKCKFMDKFRTPERIRKMTQEQALDKIAQLDEELGLNDMVREANKNNNQFRKTDME